MQDPLGNETLPGSMGRCFRPVGDTALGRSNREIGEELFITSNTVARHVSNIFTKTGVSNRAEAATYASRQGLVS